MKYRFGIQHTNKSSSYSIQGAESLHQAATGCEQVTSEEGRDILSYAGVPALPLL